MEDIIDVTSLEVQSDSVEADLEEGLTLKSENLALKSRGKPFEEGNNLSNGRGKGSKNKKTLLVEDMMERHEYSPIESMIILAQDTKTDLGIRAKLHSDLACFVYPKRKAIEHSGGSGRIIINISKEDAGNL